mmetsp:Transcript_43632/g.98510  ORF Transcript_43632/g.98510 Transcript_43632/m.98510 type:complete len:517 (-) Transcript_43632:21-1571(-)
MDGLAPNPDGCAGFEPNPFKKDRCRNCGHNWCLHLGAIAEGQARAFRQAQQQVAQAKASASIEARAKARAQRRAQRTPEDGWLFEDQHAASSGSGGASDSDGDGFRMFAGRDLDRAPIARRSAGSCGSGSKPLRIVNLIDFGECNVQAESVQGGAPSGSTSSGAAAAHWAAGGSSSSSSSFRPPGSPAPPTGGSSVGCSVQDLSAAAKSKDLLEEVHYLRQMLADSNEEKSIQVAIIRDEVTEKQRVIEELTRKGAEAEISLRAATGEIEQLRGGATKSGGGMSAAPMALLDARESSHGERSAQLDARAPGDFEASGLRDAAHAEVLLSFMEQRQIEAARREEDMRRSHQEREKDLRARCQDAEESCTALQDRLEVLREEVRSLERSSETLRSRFAAQEAELRKRRDRLDFWEAPSEATAAVASEAELRTWEAELRTEAELTLGRLADRRLELRVASLVDGALCKICYDRPASCALLPCRHHAFCSPCAARVETSREPACPLCRSHVTGIFETFAG